MKTALITGVTGQDGSYLAEFLLEKGYNVHGVVRRSATEKRERIDHLEGHPHFHLHYGDLADSMSLVRIVGLVKPDELYNLAAQSHVQVSFEVPEYTADVVATGVLRVLEAVRLCGLEKTCRILSGVHLRAVRQGGGVPAERNHALSSLFPLRRGQAVRFLDHQGIPRSLRHVRLFRYSVQS